MLSKSKFKLFACVAMCVIMMAGINSCKKDEKDYREDFVGSYTGTETFTKDGTVYTDPCTVVVTKSSEDNKVVINAEFMVAGRNESVSVEVSKDGSFSTSFPSTIGGVSQTVTISSGKFSKDGKLTYSYTVPGYVTYSVTVTKL